MDDEIGLIVPLESDSAALSMLRLSTERLRPKALGRRLGGGSLLKQTTCTLTLSVVFMFMACLTRPSAQCLGSFSSYTGRKKQRAGIGIIGLSIRSQGKKNNVDREATISNAPEPKT